jgi:hypothetical protein
MMLLPTTWRRALSVAWVRLSSRRAHVDQERHRIGHHVLHGDSFDVDDVLVLGEHQRLVAVGVHPGDVDLVHHVDDRRVPVQARHHHVLLYRAEAEHHAPLALIDLVDAEQEVDDQCNHQPEAEQPRVDADSAAAAAATEDSGELGLQLAKSLVQIGRALIAPVAPGVFATTGLIPSHLLALHFDSRCAWRTRAHAG